MAKSDEKRSRFIASALSLIKKHGFDGLGKSDSSSNYRPIFFSPLIDIVSLSDIYPENPHDRGHPLNRTNRLFMVDLCRVSDFAFLKYPIFQFGSHIVVSLIPGT